MRDLFRRGGFVEILSICRWQRGGLKQQEDTERDQTQTDAR
ncbi:MAG: hypothetical protein OXC18_15675 [Desulfurellaceae bacterium]|nr:hypothetical protein [Desulfurellaceae bacterium]